MNKVTIKFWCDIRNDYVDNNHDYAVGDDGEVVDLDWVWAPVELIPHFYLDGKRIA